MFINACFIDQDLVAEKHEETKWHVHSKYKNSFNIQDERKQTLVVVTTTNYPFMPNGIYLETTDFSKLLSTIEIGEPITWKQNSLHFSKDYLFLMHGEKYTSVAKIRGEMLAINQEKLFSYTNTLGKETGNQKTLAQFINAVEPFSEAIQQLCSNDQMQQQIGLEFLLGRGLGLTPSGDDMIVGHLAARYLLKKESPILLNVLTELLTLQSLTTDISKHYLLCAISGRFSDPVLKLMDELTMNNNEEQLKNRVNSVIAVGHTSGVDLMAGFLATIKLLWIK